MKRTYLFRLWRMLMPLGLLAALAACEDGPKTYDACILKASKDAKSDHQFQVLSKDCRERFQTRFQ